MSATAAAGTPTHHTSHAPSSPSVLTRSMNVSLLGAAAAAAAAAPMLRQRTFAAASGHDEKHGGDLAARFRPPGIVTALPAADGSPPASPSPISGDAEEAFDDPHFVEMPLRIAFKDLTHHLAIGKEGVREQLAGFIDFLETSFAKTKVAAGDRGLNFNGITKAQLCPMQDLSEDLEKASTSLRSAKCQIQTMNVGKAVLLSYSALSPYEEFTKLVVAIPLLRIGLPTFLGGATISLIPGLLALGANFGNDLLERRITTKNVGDVRQLQEQRANLIANLTKQWKNLGKAFLVFAVMEEVETNSCAAWKQKAENICANMVYIKLALRMVLGLKNGPEVDNVVFYFEAALGLVRGVPHSRSEAVEMKFFLKELREMVGERRAQEKRITDLERSNWDLSHTVGKLAAQVLALTKKPASPAAPPLMLVRSSAAAGPPSPPPAPATAASSSDDSPLMSVRSAAAAPQSPPPANAGASFVESRPLSPSAGGSADKGVVIQHVEHLHLSAPLPYTPVQTAAGAAETPKRTHSLATGGAAAGATATPKRMRSPALLFSARGRGSPAPKGRTPPRPIDYARIQQYAREKQRFTLLDPPVTN